MSSNQISKTHATRIGQRRGSISIEFVLESRVRSLSVLGLIRLSSTRRAEFQEKGAAMGSAYVISRTVPPSTDTAIPDDHYLLPQPISEYQVIS
jgi:hypothetical protein